MRAPEDRQGTPPARSPGEHRGVRLESSSPSPLLALLSQLPLLPTNRRSIPAQCPARKPPPLLVKVTGLQASPARYPVAPAARLAARPPPGSAALLLLTTEYFHLHGSVREVCLQLGDVQSLFFQKQRSRLGVTLAGVLARGTVTHNPDIRIPRHKSAACPFALLSSLR